MLQAAAAVDNLSQYSRRNSDNVSETGGDQSFHSKSFNKKGKKNGGGVDKKKVLPTKKFPELKLMISGEGRNSNNTFSSDEEAGIANVSSSLHKRVDAVPSHQEGRRGEPRCQRGWPGGEPGGQRSSGRWE